MDQHLGDDDVGKTVENANGEEIGMVAAVEGGTLHVQPDPGLLDSIRAALGWEAGREGAVPIDQGSIGEITDRRVRLDESAVNRTGEAGVGREAAGTEADRAVSAERDRRESGTEARPSPERDHPGERDAAPSDGNVDASHGVGDSHDVDRGESVERTDERPTDEMQGGGESPAAADVDAVDEMGRGMEADPTEVADPDPEARVEPDGNPDPNPEAEVDPDREERRTDAAVDPDSIDGGESSGLEGDSSGAPTVDQESDEGSEGAEFAEQEEGSEGSESAERDDRRER